MSDIKGTSWCAPYDKALFYPVEDYRKCADAIEKAIEMGRRPSNHREICEQYSIERWCEKMIRMYREVLSH